MKILVDENDEIFIKFSIALTKDKNLVADTTEELLKETFGEEIDSLTIENHEAVFRRPDFEDTIEITGALNTNESLSFQINPLKIRKARMCRLIKRWSLVDENKKPLPASSVNISKLDPIIAHIIGAQLDATVGI